MSPACLGAQHASPLPRLRVIAYRPFGDTIMQTCLHPEAGVAGTPKLLSYPRQPSFV
jgi:hypothetical protein